jgi:uncharacterized protein
MLSGIFVFVALGFGGGTLLVRSNLDQVFVGLTLAALSGVAGLAGFAVAALLRANSWSDFGVRAVSGRWLMIGAAAGIVAFAAKGIATMAYGALTGQSDNPQDIYATAATVGPAAVILGTVLIGILTPIGEEFLFRGVVTNALLRYGPVTGVLGGALIFALLHGINVIFPAALVAGLVGGEVFRRSGSIWPPVIVHVVFNLPTVPLMVLATAA